MINGSLKYVGYVLLTVIVGFIVRFNWIMLYPYKPIIIHSVKIIDNDNNADTPVVVYAGDPLYYETNYTKLIPIPAEVNRYLVGSHIITIPPYVGQAYQGKGSAKNQVEIPSLTDSGTYYLYINYTYHIGTWPTRTLVITAKSDSFQVINRTLEAQKILIENNNLYVRDVMKNKSAIDKAINKNTKSIRVLNRDMRGKQDKTGGGVNMPLYPMPRPVLPKPR